MAKAFEPSKTTGQQKPQKKAKRLAAIQANVYL
jgi:hypothetical protein